MTRRLLRGDPPLEVVLRRSARARRFSLRVSRIDGRVTLSMPDHAREAEALAFAQGHAEWIRRALERNGPRVAVGFGLQLPVQGRLLTLTPAGVRAPKVEGDRLLLPADPQRAAVRAATYLRLLARQQLQSASDHYAAQIGRSFRTITLRDTRSRWGSCTTDGRLMYSWRLILAPPSVLSYVAAHEVAHLAEMNHSDRFWKIVGRLMPEFEIHRRWLRSDGDRLHQFDFGGTRPDAAQDH